MISSKDERDFILDVIPSDLLSSAIDYISSNLEPDDVFDFQQLAEWAENNGYVEED